MPLTKHRKSITVLTEDMANSWYGGLYGSPEGDTLDPEHPLNAGHIHDGQHLDGHAQKINLSEHVTGQLSGDNIEDNSITESKLSFTVASGYRQIFADETERLNDPTVYTSGDLYSKALQVDTVTEYILTDISPTTWSLLGGGGTVVAETLKVLGMSNAYPLDGSNGQPLAITFAAAPTDILIKQFNVSVLKNVSDAPTILDYDLGGSLVYLTNLTINGSPIDTAGIGLLNVYSDFAQSPLDINIPLDEGDVLGFDLYFNAGALANISALYVNQPVILPSRNYFIGDAAPTVIPAPSVAATMTLTVNSAPTDPSDGITFQQRFNTTLDLGGTVISLDPAGGPRNSGSNDYDNTLGTPSLIAANIAAAINDSANTFDTAIGITAVAVGPVVTITAISAGPGGNQIIVDNDVPEITPSGTHLSGGLIGATATITFPAAPADGFITDIYFQMISGESYYNPFATLKTLKINGGADLLNSQISIEQLFPQYNDRSLGINIPIETGDIISMEVASSYIGAVAIPMVIVSYP